MGPLRLVYLGAAPHLANGGGDGGPAIAAAGGAGSTGVAMRELGTAGAAAR